MLQVLNIHLATTKHHLAFVNTMLLSFASLTFFFRSLLSFCFVQFTSNDFTCFDPFLSLHHIYPVYIRVLVHIQKRQRKFPAFFVVTLIENGANWKSVRIKLTASDNSNRKRLIQKAFCTVHLVECSCSHSFRITLSLRYSLSFYLVCFVFALK